MFKRAISDIRTQGNRNPILTRDGRELLIEWYDQTLRDEDGSVVGLLSIGLDITERMRVEEENALLQDQFRQSQKMEAIGKLAGGVAHDINNILAGIMGFAALFQMELERDDPKLNDVNKILDLCTRGRDLTRNLLGFARQGKYLKERIKLNDSISHIREILERTISKKIKIETRLAENLSCVEGDPNQLEQVLMNLANNAVDAISEEGTLTIAAHDVEIEQAQQDRYADLDPGRYVELSVADTGEGMDAETLSKAFEPFFTTRPQGQGTGLGLSMVYGTVKNHGGTVTLDSEPGQGATVTIMLPALEPGSGVASPESGKHETVTTGEGTILLVDDEKLVRNSVARLLQGVGYQVIQAGDGREALASYRERSDEITLVLLDLIMPVMDGAETFHELKEINPAVRVLLFSGFSADANTSGLIEEGAVGFIQKPFRPKKLVETVAKAHLS